MEGLSYDSNNKRSRRILKPAGWQGSWGEGDGLSITQTENGETWGNLIVVMVMQTHQFHSVQPLSHVWLFATSWTAARQASLSITNSRSLLKLMSMRWPKYWSFSFSFSPSNEHPRLISFRMDWLDLLAVQGTLKSLLQHHSSKASILWCSAYKFIKTQQYICLKQICILSHANDTSVKLV